MDDEKDRYIEAMLKINFALITGLESAIVFLENVEKTTEEQRQSLISQMKEIVQASRNAFREKQVH